MNGKNTPVCPTPKDALIGAIAAAARALASHPDEELHEVNFGRFAALESGWHWSFTTKSHYVSERPAMIRTTDSLEGRLKMIVKAWEEAVNRYDGSRPGDGA